MGDELKFLEKVKFISDNMTQMDNNDFGKCLTKVSSDLEIIFYLDFKRYVLRDSRFNSNKKKSKTNKHHNKFWETSKLDIGAWWLCELYLFSRKILMLWVEEGLR